MRRVRDDSGSIPELRCWVRSKSEQLAPRWSHSIVCDTHLHIWRLCRRLEMSIGRGAAPTVCQTPTIPRAVCPPIGRTHRRSTGWSPTCRRGVGPAAIFSSGTADRSRPSPHSTASSSARSVPSVCPKTSGSRSRTSVGTASAWSELSDFRAPSTGFSLNAPIG